MKSYIPTTLVKEEHPFNFIYFSLFKVLGNNLTSLAFAFRLKTQLHNFKEILRDKEKIKFINLSSYFLSMFFNFNIKLNFIYN